METLPIYSKNAVQFRIMLYGGMLMSQPTRGATADLNLDTLPTKYLIYCIYDAPSQIVTTLKEAHNRL